jgi:putative membrane protein
MVGEMRSLARLANTTLAEPGPAVRAAIAFTYTLHARLRQRPVPPEAAMYLSANDLAATAMSRNPADHILQAIARKAAHGLRAGQISDIVYTAFDARLAAIANIQVACERIATTPTPYTYTLLLHRTAYLFCFLLPVSLAPTMGVATPVFCTLIAYTFFGLDALGDELEDPFGEHANTLPLDALARIIEINLLESVGEGELPPYLEPVEYVLR